MPPETRKSRKAEGERAATRHFPAVWFRVRHRGTSTSEAARTGARSTGHGAEHTATCNPYRRAHSAPSPLAQAAGPDPALSAAHLTSDPPPVPAAPL
ncbi:hypothetical protein NDU88_008254 [Pleurodeles waltl]|uniref:Uncharacterized protein n=1 Tax=Pleurodeles waltl TaxID=8319 RepID=A0AAV7VUZ3_PLEWA|nr:hypothetical protein NDU88_008254 [Pleurodeles waltl]